MDEEEDEVGEVALAGEDTCWVGHVFLVLSVLSVVDMQKRIGT